MATRQAEHEQHSALRPLLRERRQAAQVEVAALVAMRDRYRRQLEAYRAIPGSDTPPGVEGDAARQAAVEAAWQACREAYAAWQAAFETWEALRQDTR